MDTGLACLLVVARCLGVPADGDRLRHELAPAGAPFGDVQLLLAASRLGLRAARVRSRWARLPALPLPAIASRTDGRYLVLARADAEKVLIQDPREPRPTVQTRATFEAGWDGSLLLLARRTGDRGAERPFGFRWFLPAILKHRRPLGEVLVASFFLQLFALLSPLFTQVVIDKVLVHRGLTTLHVLAIGMLALTVFEVVLAAVRAYVLAHTSSRLDVELGSRVFRHVLALPLAYFEARRAGDTVARVRELETIRQLLTGPPLTLAIDVFFTGLFFLVMGLYSLPLTGIVLAALPAYALLWAAITPALRARLSERFDRGAESYAFLVESVVGVETIKAMAVEPQMQRRWDDRLAAYVRASLRAVTLGTLAGQTAAFLSKATTIALLWAGAYQVLAGDLSVGELVAFNMLAGRVTGPVLRLLQCWHEFQQAGLSVERLGDVLNAPLERGAGASRTSLPRLAGEVVFERVTFRYRPDGPEVLRDMSFAVPPAGIVGLVGPSGSGKSTVAKLIQRLYVPERGRILIDGVDVAQVDPAWLRRQVGIVLQDSILFHRSVRENIALADPGIPIEDVVRTARLAGAHEFILALPEGYDTLVGEHGRSLSGGQRQRIAIARALVTDPRVLVLDEATSALDYGAEQIIQANLAEICAGRTVFIIAHRLSAIQPAHRVLVIEGGQVVEEGTHEDLLAARGYYAGLWARQNGRPAPGAGVP